MAFGLLPDQVDELPARTLDLLSRYWKAEPWGPWRDNFHAALVAREVRRPYMKDQAKNLLSDFMHRDPDERRQSNVRGLIAFFRTIATKRKRKPDEPVG